ncbi:hypothetical protein EJ05DRAFT_473090 [Pseudovirgaria hyperparasitica]|uniref:Iron-sulfur assembly protein 1 n=1 Tax=Pseudovirgaria hyperparasitica TaxID=470096 RepID=A0A6A6WH79_9PEZI|nr:uncharacterized protein EJ05DRAFT_473090 [Pseudovirgaria hyperparasitica]KAF2762162.1 hypothetical protein EJ05DRAFT_473090 [Pseudovirgaria hyperparasitica]
MPSKHLSQHPFTETYLPQSPSSHIYTESGQFACLSNLFRPSTSPVTMSTAQLSSVMSASLRFAAQVPRSQRRCPQCLRMFSSYKPFRASSRREMQTATAYQPSTLEPPPPPPRNEPAPPSSITQQQSTSRWKSHTAQKMSDDQKKTAQETLKGPETAISSTISPSTQQTLAKPRRFNFAKRKAIMKLSPTAVDHLRQLLEQPEPKLIRIGTKNKGCSGLAYHLEYVDKPSKLDEQVEQDGVKVLVDNRALLNIIGSEMDWLEDKLSARFVFKNPNITEQCGCGESFSVK